MHAGFLRAGDGFLLAMRPNPALHTLASIAVAFFIVVARTSVQARHGCTVANARLAVGSGVTGRALASIRTLSGVETSSPVLARLVVSAKVQILIAEQPTPAFVAQAFPGLLAGSVHASRVGLTLVAQLALPSRLATEE